MRGSFQESGSKPMTMISRERSKAKDSWFVESVDYAPSVTPKQSFKVVRAMCQYRQFPKRVCP